MGGVMPAGYEVIRVAKGALVYECDRCGAVVLHPTIHDAWHVTLAEGMARAFGSIARVWEHMP